MPLCTHSFFFLFFCATEIRISTTRTTKTRKETMIKVLTPAYSGGVFYFWGLSIETVTATCMTLAIGLCIDYAAHIGSHFMTVQGKSFHFNFDDVINRCLSLLHTITLYALASVEFWLINSIKSVVLIQQNPIFTLFKWTNSKIFSHFYSNCWCWSNSIDWII